MLDGLPETSLGAVAAQAGLPVEFITTVIALIAPRLVSPLGAYFKRWRKTSGPDTRTIIKVLTALLVGAGGFALGLYGYDVRGLLNAVVAAFLTYFKTIGEYERDVNVQAKAARATPDEEAPLRAAPPDEVPASPTDILPLLSTPRNAE